MKALGKAIGPDEAVLLVALVLLTAGLWALVDQAALIATGAVLLYIALPRRLPFILRNPRADARQIDHRK